MWKKTEKWIVKWEVLLFILIGVAIFRIPNLFEPYWYGDEGIYLGIGQAINSGVTLYSEIHDNKPPFIYWIAALTAGEQFWYRLVFFFWMIVTTIVFWFVAHKVTPKTGGLATILFAIFTTWPTWEGNIANAELFFLLPVLIGFWLTSTFVPKKIFLGGIFYGLAILFKVPAGFSLFVWPLFWLLEKRSDWLKKCLWLGLGVLAPVAITFGVAYFQGAIREYMVSAWLQNIPYLSSWQGSATVGIMSMKVRLVALVFVLAVTLGLSSRWGKHATILSVWAVFDLFSALLSTRPYPHYLLQMTPALALLVGLAVQEARARLMAGLVVVLLVLSVIGFKFYQYPGIQYYTNFLAWIAGQKEIWLYRGWFDPQVNNNYKIAEIIQSYSSPSDLIYVWGDQPTIYPLSQRRACGKYLVKYHVLDFFNLEENWRMQNLCQPKIIVDLGGYGGRLDEYMLIARVEQAQIWRRMR